MTPHAAHEPMSLHVHRSPKVEALVDALHRELACSWPRDPFASVPVVVGSRGMGRWLRHELATRAKSVARIDFLFPRNAFEAAAAWLLEPTDRDNLEDAVFWDVHAADDAWSGPKLVARVLVALRARIAEPSFAAVRRYLGAEDTVEAARPVGRREVLFAAEVASVVEKLHYDRPSDALLWASEPSKATSEHRWLADLLQLLEAEVAPERLRIGLSPAARLARLRTRKGQPIARTLHVFGLSSLRPGDKLRLTELAKHLEIHLYALVPSQQWWGDLKDKRVAVKEIRKKLAEATLSSLARSEIDQLFTQNDQLASNGSPSRDLQLWLEETSYLDDHVDDEEGELQSGPETLLQSVQKWVAWAAPSPVTEAPPWREFVGCPSLEVHACHGELRQCEALRDELLRRFAADTTLEPRHVLVTTPDVATYAPLVAAVFGRASGGVPAIPVHIADLGLRGTNAVADALMRTLELTEERVTGKLLVELLELEPVRRRFGLSEADMSAVRELVVDSGLRWAWDKGDRAAHSQPEREQNTVRFALERMALGVLMPDDEPLFYLDGIGDFDPAVPFDVASRDRAAQFGKFAAFCDALARERESLRMPATVMDWRERLLRAVDALTRVDDDDARLRAQVTDALRLRLPDGIGDELTLDKSGVVALIADAFDVPAKGDRLVTGAVTVCAMEPMRSVPFRIIAMLGCDDGAFPRSVKTAAWDPFATSRIGEHDRRTLDRHLFLETLLCARDGLLLFGTGFEPKRGDEIPLSVVASEVAELLVKGTGLTPDDAKALDWPTRRHPLQPWSERAFDVPALPSRGPDDVHRARTTSERWPYDPVWFEARQALVLARTGDPRRAGLGATSPSAVWPSESHAPTALTVDALATALENASRELLKGRLGLAFHRERDDEEVPDREPIELDVLDTWNVRERVLIELDSRAGDGGEEARARVGRLLTRLRAEGSLPLDAGGAEVVASAERDARSVHTKANTIGGGARPSIVATVHTGGLAVSAHAEDVRILSESGDAETELVFVWKTASNVPNERAQLTAWLTLLIARAAGYPVTEARVVGVDKNVTLRSTASREAARDSVAELTTMWREMREGPVLLFPKLSKKAVEVAAGNPLDSAAQVLAKCSTAWEGGFMERGAKDDPWVKAAYFEMTLSELPAEAILRVATLVWGPVLAGQADASVSKSQGRAP